MLSIVVLTAGLLPILGAMNSAFNTSRDSQDTVIAAGLAQEGVELVQNVKDNGVLASNDAFVAFSSGNRTCRIDYDDAVLATPSVKLACSSLGVNPHDLTIDGSGFYVHANTPGKFKRKMIISYLGAPNDEAKVVSAVYWSSTVPTLANYESTCTTANSCVYSEAMLRPWK